MKKFLIAAVASVALLSTPASATVTFDPDTGYGWVGKGDVQNAFGLNNAGMQAVHESVYFTYEDTFSVEVTCEWFTGPPGNQTRHINKQERSGGVNSTLGSDSRRTGQCTGWFLEGFSGELQGDGDVPQVGDPCPGNEGNGKVVIAVEDLGSSDAVLKAWIGNDYRVIWP